MESGVAPFSRKALATSKWAFSAASIKASKSVSGIFNFTVVFALIGTEPGHMVSDGDPLVERFHDGKFNDSSEIGLS